jgi:homoserine kinase
LTINASAEAFAPASMGNVGVGFDILGLAFDGLGDVVRVEPCDASGAIIQTIEGGNDLPLDPAQNTASVAVNAFLSRVESTLGIAITIKKGLPLASGLGGSAASAVAAVVAANALLGNPLSREGLLPACLEGEAIVSGYHLDNIAPSLLGGITLILGGRKVQPLPVPPNMFFALVTPDVRVSTAAARSVLPQSVSLKALIDQTGAVAQLVDALHRRDVSSAAAAMEQDTVIEPARAHLIPRFYEVRQAAKKAGALGVVISGAGSTLCAVCNSTDVSRQVAGAMKSVYDVADIDSTIHNTQVSQRGAQVLSVR